MHIFVYGTNPYTYINAITHGVTELNVGSVYIYGIAHEDDKGNVREPKPGDILTKINTEIKNLSSLDFGLYDPKKKTTSRILIKDKDGLEVYNRAIKVLNSKVGGATIEHKDLVKEVGKIIEDYKDAIFDVTSLKKNLLVEISTICLAKNFKQIFSSEIINKEIKHDESEVYHTLIKNNQFKYRNILDSKHIDSSLRSIFRKDFFIKIALALLFVLMIVIVSFFIEDTKFVWIMTILNLLGIAGTVISLVIEYPRK